MALCTQDFEMQDSGKAVVLGNYLCLHPGWKCALGNGNQETKLTVLILSLTGCAPTESSTAGHSAAHQHSSYHRVSEHPTLHKNSSFYCDIY